MVTPNAIPRGIIVTLWTGSDPGSFAATNACPASWYAVTFFSSSERISDLRSTPIKTLSLATSKSNINTALRFCRAAASAASLTMLAKSAPENPGVRAPTPEDPHPRPEESCGYARAKFLRARAHPDGSLRLAGQSDRGAATLDPARQDGSSRPSE